MMSREIAEGEPSHSQHEMHYRLARPRQMHFSSLHVGQFRSSVGQYQVGTYRICVSSKCVVCVWLRAVPVRTRTPWYILVIGRSVKCEISKILRMDK